LALKTRPWWCSPNPGKHKGFDATCLQMAYMQHPKKKPAIVQIAGFPFFTWCRRDAFVHRLPGANVLILLRFPVVVLKGLPRNLPRALCEDRGGFQH